VFLPATPQFFISTLARNLPLAFHPVSDLSRQGVVQFVFYSSSCPRQVAFPFACRLIALTRNLPKQSRNVPFLVHGPRRRLPPPPLTPSPPGRTRLFWSDTPGQSILRTSSSFLFFYDLPGHLHYLAHNPFLRPFRLCFPKARFGDFFTLRL